MDSYKLRLAIRNDLSEITGVNEAIRGFSKQLELPNEMDFTLQLVAEELLSNIVLYAYPEPGPHMILFDVEVDPDNVSVRVQDDGIAFNLLEQSPPVIPDNLAEMKVGGLGIHLVRKMMDDIIYHRENGQNTLVLKKRIQRTVKCS